MREMRRLVKRGKAGYAPRQQFAFTGKADFNGEDSDENYSDADENGKEEKEKIETP